MHLLARKAVIAAVLFSLCGTLVVSVESGVATASGTKKIVATWLYTGPQNDGGYNTSQELAMNAMAKLPNVKATGIYNLGYTAQTGSIITQAIAKGTNVIVDTMGLGSILTNICKKNPKVYCYSGGDTSTQPANSTSFWLPDWNLGYAAGVAAGLLTKTNTIGFIGPSAYPGLVLDVNAYALGCQSVDAKCKVKVVFDGSYFDPPTSTKAVQTLISSGVDVIRGWIDDPSYCKVAQSSHVYAVGQFNDMLSACPKSIITSTFWNFTNYYKAQAAAIQAGKFKSSGSGGVFVPLSSSAGSPGLGKFGSFVPASVKAKVLAVFAKAVAGKNLIVGPIYDQTGKLRYKAGVAVPPRYMFTRWNWYVKGVITSK
jgi:basic membrane protein A